jgi:hypothetical protein
MVRKVYKKLTEEQKNRSVIFSSCLSRYRFETTEDTKHEVFSFDVDKHLKIARLKDDKFFNSSHFKFNVIRQ